MTDKSEPTKIKDPLVGTLFADHYRIDRLLARSSMSVVYRGVDEQRGNTVAVKVLNTVLADRETMQRFHREAQIARTLMHPNVVALLDHGVTAEGTPYHVLEFIDGQTLEDILGVVGSLNAVEAVEIFIKTCRAVQYLHSRGIVHRDLKPGNLMVLNKASHLSVKVIDFGIAKGTKSGVHQSLALTKPGVVFGSLLYTAPERLSGEKGDSRSDIYSLGCLMYETLTGVNPFSADSPEAIVELQLKGNVDPLAKAGLNPKISLLLQPIVTKALEKEPNRRFQTAAELKDALEQIEGPVKLAWGQLAEQAKDADSVAVRRKAVMVTAIIFGVCLASLVWAIFLLWEMQKVGLLKFRL